VVDLLLTIYQEGIQHLAYFIPYYYALFQLLVVNERMRGIDEGGLATA
jgi:hypothetical protein